MKDDIVKYILENKIINDYFTKIPKEYVDEFIQHIWLIIMEMIESKYDKVEELYLSNSLGKYLVGMINNQLKSKTSSFHKLYRSNNNVVIIDDVGIIDNEYIEINNKEIIEDIIHILNNMHYVDTILFKMYRGIDPITNELIKPKTYKEIEEITNIKYATVWYSINKVTKILKNKIKL